jgi:hypothetical protein
MWKNVSELLESANKEYAEIETALQSILRGEMPADQANKQIKKNLDNVDNLINKYGK